jgi:hypothetical protein
MDEILRATERGRGKWVAATLLALVVLVVVIGSVIEGFHRVPGAMLTPEAPAGRRPATAVGES